MENILLNGTELILNRIYDRVGFDEIEDDILRYLSIARLSQPMSKSATVDYLKSYFNEDFKLQYNSLWVIEKAIRVTKGTLQIRPMFHFTPRRIEAYLSICFVAYKLYKELERILKQEGFTISVDKVLALANTIITLRIRLPKSRRIIEKNMFLTPVHKSIVILFDDDFWNNLI